MLNFIIGYLVIINIASMIFLYVDMKIKLNLAPKTINIIYLILGSVGGCIGILVTSQMFGFKNDEKIIKKWIPLIVFIEIVVIGFIIAKANEII